MKSFGKRQQIIQELNAKLAKLEERDLTFKAYQDKKQQLKDLTQK
jgi:cell shape-determining protein MreC